MAKKRTRKMLNTMSPQESANRKQIESEMRSSTHATMASVQMTDDVTCWWGCGTARTSGGNGKGRQGTVPRRRP